MDDELKDDEETRFPAPVTTPGQGTSRAAYARFVALDQEQKDRVRWLEDWERLRGEGWDWRKAAYIAWKASPALGRWPATQKELASDVLGLQSDRVIRTWIAKEPGIEERIARLQVEPLLQHRRDVIEALCLVAATPDPKANADRKLFLEMTGDYRGSQQVEVTVPDDVKDRLARLLGAADDGSGNSGAAEGSDPGRAGKTK